MEILQTIWTALTNENQTLINILSIPMTIIEISLALMLFTQILNISYTNKQKLIYLITFSSLSSIVCKFFHFWIW